jgi:kumamolisin
MAAELKANRRRWIRASAIVGLVVAACIPLGIVAGQSSAAGTLAASRAADLPGASTPWGQLLALSTDLGPADVRSIDVLLTLRTESRPIDLERWARKWHLRVTWDTGEEFAVLSGPATTVGKALDVRVDSYRSRTGSDFYAASQQPLMPAALAAEVTGIGRISNYGRPSNELVPHDFVPNGGLTPAGLLQAYQATPLAERGFQGQGETIVLIEYTPVKLSDLNQFTKKFDLPPIQLQFVGGNGTELPTDFGEADMDIETVHEIAPKAKLVYFNMAKAPGVTNTTDFTSDMALSIAAVAKQFPGVVISMSLQECELDSDLTEIDAINSAANDAEGTGSTLYASSADAGGADCGSFSADSLTSSKGVSIPAVAPDVTGVGGTTLSVTTDGDYLGETTWSSPMLSQGSGGGVSTIVSRPSWQIGRGVGAGGVPDMREVPDIAADADPITGNTMVVSGMFGVGGGTSLSSPIMAGFTSLIDEFLHASGGPPLGFANPLFYKLANETKLSPPPFHDITVGGNVFYRAGPGYDPVTGLGSPDVAALAQDILAATKRSAS